MAKLELLGTRDPRILPKPGSSNKLLLLTVLVVVGIDYCSVVVVVFGLRNDRFSHRRHFRISSLVNPNAIISELDSEDKSPPNMNHRIN